MGYAEHPLADIFSPDDLERLARGICLHSNGRADPHVAWRLTESGYESDPWLGCLREWYLQAASHGPDVACHYKHEFRSRVDSLKDFCQPAGELRAAYFFQRQQGFQLAYIPVDPVGKRRTPEFEISHGNTSIVVEVKTIGDYPWGGGGYFVGAVRSRAECIRAAIKDALGQFDEAKRNLLVITDQDRPPIPPADVLAAMRGTLYLSIPYGPNGPVGEVCVRRDRDGELGPQSKTRIGAIGVLSSDICVESRACFVHNMHAKRPIPPEGLDPWPQFMPGMIPRNSTGSYWR